MSATNNLPTTLARTSANFLRLTNYLTYLQNTIDAGLQWVGFEPNGEKLWAKVRSTVSDFLIGEWHKQALLGSRPEEAFYVKCDRSTMTQNDISSGRLICLVGVAVVKPAEFVIIRINKTTCP